FERLFPGVGLPDTMPVVLWALALELLGLLAFPLLHEVCGALPDRGWALSKTVGLLLVAFLSWLAASVGLASFSRTTIAACVALLALGAWLVARRTRARLEETWREARRLIVLEEALFWGAFLFLVLVRMANPDLWHPERGGEKPMDFAYFNAVLKSP